MGVREPAGRAGGPDARTGGGEEPWGRAAECFARWADGDPGGLDELVRLLTPVLWHVVRAYRLPADVAEDVIQTSWLALVRSRDAIRDPGAVGGWLTTTARREAWRAHAAHERALPVDEEDLAPRLPRERSAESDVVAHEQRRALWDAVDRLPLRCQRLLRVVAFTTRPDYTQLSADLGMPVGSIGPTRGRCLAKLRVALIEAGEG